MPETFCLSQNVSGISVHAPPNQLNEDAAPCGDGKT